MSQQTKGIHHVTAFVRDAQQTVDFYAGVLGLRLIKKTINFDAPEVYHLYFGNELGNPGTIITFFPYAGSRKGRIGGGQVGYTTYVVPTGTLDYWEARLKSFQISVTRAERFGEVYVQFADKDGLRLEIVEREAGPLSQWSIGGVPSDKAIKGFGGAILYSMAPVQTGNLLVEVMGLTKITQNETYTRYAATGDLGNLIDVNIHPMELGAGGAGTVHHIAWRAKDDVDHGLWRSHVEQHGFHPTPIVDRQYFNAIYFRETGGILFEIATDPPGFTRDEEPDALGEKLMLPEWLEARRSQIENNLPPIQVRALEGNNQ